VEREKEAGRLYATRRATTSPEWNKDAQHDLV